MVTIKNHYVGVQNFEPLHNGFLLQNLQSCLMRSALCFRPYALYALCPMLYALCSNVELDALCQW